MKKLALFSLAFAATATLNAATYKNPVLTMDFSDPDVCVGHDGKFYMTASSFGGLPGLPILVSDDLVNWEYAAYALKEHPFYVRGPEHGNAFGRRQSDAGRSGRRKTLVRRFGRTNTSSTGAIQTAAHTGYPRRIRADRGASRASSSKWRA